MNQIFKPMNNLPKLVLTDIDGVWTDGGMYYDQTGNELKKFNTTDSAGVLFLKILNIPLGIITGENTEIVKRRAAKLKTKNVFLGVKNKVKIALELCEELNISLADVAYIGDDINDIQLLKMVGFAAAPQNAPEYVKREVDFITKMKGGDGAFREFIEYIVEKNSSIDLVLDHYFKLQNEFEQ